MPSLKNSRNKFFAIQYFKQKYFTVLQKVQYRKRYWTLGEILNITPIVMTMF